MRCDEVQDLELGTDLNGAEDVRHTHRRCQTDSTDRNHKDRGNCQHNQLSDQSEPQLLR